MSSSSTNKRACRGHRVSTAKRMAASLAVRSGSLSLAASLARFQRQPSQCSQRRTVSADTHKPRRASRLKASVAQLQRVRHQPSALGGFANKASRLRRSEGSKAKTEAVSWRWCTNPIKDKPEACWVALSNTLRDWHAELGHPIEYRTGNPRFPF